MKSAIAAPFATMSLNGGRDKYLSGMANLTFSKIGNWAKPPDGQGSFWVSRQGSSTLHQLLHGSHLLGHLEEDYVERFPTFETLVEFVWINHSVLVVVMMRAEEFDHSVNFVERHFFANGEARITVPFHGFWKTRDQNATTEEQFYQGQPQVIFNPDISYSFIRWDNSKPEIHNRD
jgi:hypothetical protein